MEQILVANLAPPQQVRCCYTCWRSGHFSAQFPLIPESEGGGYRAASRQSHAQEGTYIPDEASTTGTLCPTFHKKNMPDPALVASHISKPPVIANTHPVDVGDESAEKYLFVETKAPNGSLYCQKPVHGNLSERERERENPSKVI